MGHLHREGATTHRAVTTEGMYNRQLGMTHTSVGGDIRSLQTAFFIAYKICMSIEIVPYYIRDTMRPSVQTANAEDRYVSCHEPSLSPWAWHFTFH